MFRNWNVFLTYAQKNRDFVIFLESPCTSFIFNYIFAIFLHTNKPTLILGSKFTYFVYRFSKSRLAAHLLIVYVLV